MARILIVEDNLDLLRTMSELLSDEHEVMMTDLGETALEMAERDRPDLVMLDIQLPGIDGLETGRRLKGTLGPIPILVLSALAQNADTRHILQSGCCDAYLAKPAPLAKIRAMVEELLGSHRHA
ncbi:MAG TPA: response regulator [Longimicrobiales bacterium]|nr:response regulator [Longimicrobiales bacterium]